MEPRSIKINSAKELYALPGYVGDVDPANDPLLRIVTSYWLSPMLSCGLKSCHPPRNEGFVVELSGNRLTNVGHVCGEQFGETFSQERKNYTDKVLRPEAIRKLGELKARLAGMHMTLHGLRNDTNLLCERIAAFRNKFSRLGGELVRRANDGRDQVFESVARSKEEIETMMAGSPGARREQFQYREELRGRIPGLSIFSVKLRDEIVASVVDQAETLVDLDLASLATDKLLVWGLWANGFDDALAKSRSLLDAGYGFFTESTFQLLAYIAYSKDEATQLRKLTPGNLLKGEKSSSSSLASSVLPSKRERAAQKKLDAILKRGGRGY